MATSVCFLDLPLDGNMGEGCEKDRFLWSNRSSAEVVRGFRVFLIGHNHILLYVLNELYLTNCIQETSVGKEPRRQTSKVPQSPIVLVNKFADQSSMSRALGPESLISYDHTHTTLPNLVKRSTTFAHIRQTVQ